MKPDEDSVVANATSAPSVDRANPSPAADDLEVVLAALLASSPHPLPVDIDRHVARHPQYADAIRAYGAQVLTTAIEGGGILGAEPDAAELEHFRSLSRRRAAATSASPPGGAGPQAVSRTPMSDRERAALGLPPRAKKTEAPKPRYREF